MIYLIQTEYKNYSLFQLCHASTLKLMEKNLRVIEKYNPGSKVIYVLPEGTKKEYTEIKDKFKDWICPDYPDWYYEKSGILEYIRDIIDYSETENEEIKMEKEVVYNYSDYPDDKWISLDPIFLDKDIDLPEDYKGRWMINKKYQILNTKTGAIIEDFKPSERNIYPKTVFSIKGKCVSFKIHRIVALIFIPNPDNKPVVNHKGTDKSRYDMEYLEWVTKAENSTRDKKDSKTKYSFRLRKFKNFDPEFNYTKKDYIQHGFSTYQVLESIRSGNRYLGYYWEKVDTDLEEYKEKYRYFNPTRWDNNEDTWKINPKYTKVVVEVNKNGIVRINGVETLGCKMDNIKNYIIHIKGESKPILLHRLVWETFNGDIPEGYVIDHVNTDPFCNLLDNLQVVDSKGNMNNPITILKKKENSGVLKHPKILQYSIEGDLVSTFDYFYEVPMRTGILSLEDIVNSCEDSIKLYGFDIYPVGEYFWFYEGSKMIDRYINLGYREYIINKFDSTGKRVKVIPSIPDYFKEYTVIPCQEMWMSLFSGLPASDGFYYRRGPFFDRNYEPDVEEFFSFIEKYPGYNKTIEDYMKNLSN